MLKITSGRSFIYIRESVGTTMQPWGTLELTGYSCEDFPSRTSQSHLLLRKKKKYLTQNSIRYKFVKKANIRFGTLSKALDISSVTAGVAPHLLKALAILSDTTVRRSATN